MAVKPANSNYHTFTFNGVRAADYGIYVTDVNVFNSAARDVEYIEIPGRDGAFALDRGRFQNISVVYKCAMTQDTDEDFATAISEFRNAIASTKGYKRLEDDIHTDEYRMGVFSKGLEAPTLNTKTATFEVTFDCKPQRFLKSGEIPRTIGGAVTNPQTKSGAVVSIDSDGGDKATSLIATIEAVQAGSGDPSPTNVRAITGQTSSNFYVGGKNILRINRVTTTVSGVTFTINSDGSIHVEGTTTANNVFLNLNYCGATKMAIPAGTWKAKVGAGASGNVRLQLISNDVLRGQGGTADFNSITIPEGSYNSWCRLQIQNSGTTVNETLYPMICADTETSGTFKGYDGKFVSVSFGSAGTVYGGTVDVVTGVLTVTHQVESFNGSETWGSEQTSGGLINYYLNLDNASKMAGRQGGLLDDELLCNWLAPSSSITTYGVYVGATSRYLNVKCQSASDVAAFKSMLTATPLVIVYPLATPQTYNLTTQEVELLAGQNNVWADTGDISITYGHDPNKLVNPTLFEASPLLHLWGYGTVNMLADDQDSQIVINNDEYGKTLLANKVTKSSSSVSAEYNKSSTALLNNNDAIQVSAGSVLSISFDTAIGIVNVTNVSVSNTSTYDMSMTYSTTTHGMYFVINFSLEQIDFVFSQTNQYKNSEVNVTVNYTQNGTAKTASFVVRIHAQSVYSRSRDNISVDLSASVKTSGAAFYINSSRPQSSTIQPIYGISTKRPFSDDADFYVDLDIGEAYREEDGQIINVNNAVTIPAKLPVLKSGANTITYDNTITQFKIVPRWWEV